MKHTQSETADSSGQKIDPVSEKGAHAPSASMTSQLAAGLIWQDRRILPALYLLCIGPALLYHVVDTTTFLTLFVLKAAGRLSALFVLWQVTNRAIRSLTQASTSGLHIAARVQYWLLGLFIWLVLGAPSSMFPSELVAIVLNPAIWSNAWPLPLLGVVFALLIYRYFFWFFYLLVPQRGASVLSKLHQAGQLVARDPYAPIKVWVAPAGLTYLLIAMTEAPYPDGRHLGLALLGASFSGLQWLLCCYATIAYALEHLSEPDWRSFELDPYRQARLTTLKLQGQKLWPGMLELKTGLQLLALGILIEIANVFRLAELPSSIMMDNFSLELAPEVATVQFQARDPEFHFRGFRPVQARILGADGSLLSPYPLELSVDGVPIENLTAFPRGREVGLVRMKFPIKEPPKKCAVLVRRQKNR